MKLKKAIVFIVFCCHLLFFTPHSMADENRTPDGPSAHLPSNVFEFPTVVDGEKVSNEFIIINKGSAPLIIERIATSCGCIATRYTEEEIPPGGRGSFTLTLDTEGYGGNNVNKSTAIFTNDPENERLMATISGYVEKFARITPRFVNLRGPAGMKIKSRVAIVPEGKYSFKITGAAVSDGENIMFSLDEKKEAKGLSYQLTVENTRREKGEYSDVISLETDSDVKPEINIKVLGKIM